MLSFTAGFFLMLMMVLTAVILPGTRTVLFDRALRTHAPVAAQTELSAFAGDTMAYLRGQKAAWEPEQCLSIPVSKPFRDHMHALRARVVSFPGLWLKMLLLIALALYVGYNRRWLWLGMLTPGLTAVAAVAWALVDFDGFWMALHKVLIPDGIFPAGEPIMQLFPIELFIAYIPPVLATLAVEILLLWGIDSALRMKA